MEAFMESGNRTDANFHFHAVLGVLSLLSSHLGFGNFTVPVTSLKTMEMVEFQKLANQYFLNLHYYNVAKNKIGKKEADKTFVVFDGENSYLKQVLFFFLIIKMRNLENFSSFLFYYYYTREIRLEVRVFS